MKNVFAYLEGKTVIVVSHRLLPFSLFDQTLRLEGGKFCCVEEL